MAWKYDTSIRFTKPLQTPLQYNSYTIKRGDTLGAIAKAYGTDINTLLKWNPQIKDANKIYAGAALNVIGPSEPLFKETTPVRVQRTNVANQPVAARVKKTITPTLPEYSLNTDEIDNEINQQNLASIQRATAKNYAPINPTPSSIKLQGEVVNTKPNNQFGISRINNEILPENNPFSSVINYALGSLSPMRLKRVNEMV